jgi:putative transposase
VTRTWKYRLYPTRSQAAELERQLGLLCDVYNSALEQRRRMWRDHGASIGYREQSRRDHAHKVTRAIADRYPAIAVEDLDVRSMTCSARGTVDEPGRNVRAKAGLNRAIADSGWGQLRELLAYKLEERGGQLVAVPAQHTSQTCVECGYRAAENRPSRALFACAACGHQAHADVNAARVIARRGEQKLYGSGETRVEDAAMAAPTKPNPLPPSDPARALATPSEAGRDCRDYLAKKHLSSLSLATPSEAGRDFHDRCRAR